MGENDPYFCVSLSAGAERLLRQSIHPNRLGFFGSISRAKQRYFLAMRELQGD